MLRLIAKPFWIFVQTACVSHLWWHLKAQVAIQTLYTLAFLLFRALFFTQFGGTQEADFQYCILTQLEGIIAKFFIIIICGRFSAIFSAAWTNASPRSKKVGNCVQLDILVGKEADHSSFSKSCAKPNHFLCYILCNYLTLGSETKVSENIT